MSNPQMPNSKNEAASDADRRKFLTTCGKFAVVTPPAITMLLSTSLTSTAIAGSNANYGNGNGNAYGHSDGKGNNGYGNGGGDGGKKEDIDR